jgi:hypothetical protein
MRYDYVAWKDGWVNGLVVDDPAWKKETAKAIADWVKRGCTIERMSAEQVRAIPIEKFRPPAAQAKQAEMFDDGK